MPSNQTWISTKEKNSVFFLFEMLLLDMPCQAALSVCPNSFHTLNLVLPGFHQLLWVHGMFVPLKTPSGCVDDCQLATSHLLQMDWLLHSSEGLSMWLMFYPMPLLSDNVAFSGSRQPFSIKEVRNQDKQSICTWCWWIWWLKLTCLVLVSSVIVLVEGVFNCFCCSIACYRLSLLGWQFMRS